jgi:hypothetical protein
MKPGTASLHFLLMVIDRKVDQEPMKAVENRLQWSLEVGLKEDGSLKKKEYSARNYNSLSKRALSLLDKERSTKKSKPIKRQLAALNDDYSAKILRVEKRFP